MELINDQRILESIVKKAWTDRAFKENLIANPVATLEKFFEHPIHLPQGKTITVVDQSNASTFFINIPANPNLVEDMELSEEQLDIISGGGGDGQTPPIIVK